MFIIQYCLYSKYYLLRFLPGTMTNDMESRSKMRCPCPHRTTRESLRILMMINILGIDILQTSVGEFCLGVRVIKPVLRGNANWTPQQIVITLNINSLA